MKPNGKGKRKEKPPEEEAASLRSWLEGELAQARQLARVCEFSTNQPSRTQTDTTFYT
jgi:hypothetical protein